MDTQNLIIIWTLLLIGMLLGKLQDKYLKSANPTRATFRLISAASILFYALGVILILMYTVENHL
ncbi:hypothetical protein N180_19730 [Pedobacter antarcticus 4BY]|uniref:Uncharacterized protein n=2 Tax=Pedobacter antarcticus TaxID=34086 RepID=A0A081PDM5_9SPHI|nr:hypothetical protein [Pedobacter antarcticus]KEQ28798.1 hypothetical protein N180_19730 [Pedobacter antarcticus 4BY]SFF43047.1 hypothetical protein SAMN03003324_03824 [Pedobacter antarcticus]